MRTFVFVVALAAATGGCALRPRYTDFVSNKTEGKELTFVVTDVATGEPLANAKVELSELRNRLQFTTGVDGTFKVPIEKKYLDENPVFVVSLPKGLKEYRLSVVPEVVPVPLTPFEQEVPVQSPAAPAVDTVPDAGSPASSL